MSDPPGGRPAVMLRAGGALRAATTSAVPAATGPAVYLADVSEFQPDLADAAYLAWSKAVIIRAMYGAAHDDGAWHGGARRDALHAGGVAWLGIYQYLAAGQDAAAQARALVSLVGGLRPGEKLICDLEEGNPQAQAARWRQWQSVITGAYGPAAEPWLYSGLNFAAAAGLSPHWVAAYQAAEPAGSHVLWQFTDSYQVPGVGTCDCNVYRGPASGLAARGWQAAMPQPAKPPPAVPAPVPVPPGWQEAMMAQLPVLAQGASGAAVRTLQALLTARGYPAVIDGSFGPATKAALLAFQRHCGLAADGVAGPLTWPDLLGI